MKRRNAGRITRTISIEAEREYVVAVASLAGQSGQPIGAFVRAAIDSYCGSDLDKIIQNLADVDTQKYQSNHEAEPA